VLILTVASVAVPEDPDQKSIYDGSLTVMVPPAGIACFRTTVT